MPLSKPSYPVYDADTFNKLKDLVDVFFANDEYLETIAGEPKAPSRIDVTLASGYTNNANYVNLRTVKVGPQVTLETGVNTCPASFAAATYYTVGTVDSAHRPTDGKMRMGVAHLYSSTGGTVEIWPLQMRINTSGQIQILSPAARANVDYLLLGQLSWNV